MIIDAKENECWSDSEGEGEGSDSVNGKECKSGRWTKEEHDTFLLGLGLYGRDWKKVATAIKTRTPSQIRSHAQKYFQKLSRSPSIIVDGPSPALEDDDKDAFSVLEYLETTLKSLKRRRDELDVILVTRSQNSGNGIQASRELENQQLFRRSKPQNNLYSDDDSCKPLNSSTVTNNNNNNNSIISSCSESSLSNSSPNDTNNENESGNNVSDSTYQGEEEPEETTSNDSDSGDSNRHQNASTLPQDLILEQEQVVISTISMSDNVKNESDIIELHTSDPILKDIKEENMITATSTDHTEED